MSAQTQTASNTASFQSTHDFLHGLWCLADPKISIASFASMFLGACAAAAVVPLDWGWLALTVLGIFCIEVGKNASGEIYDFDSGVDQAVSRENRTPFSGGKRVLVDGLLTREETKLVAVIGFALGTSIGFLIATRAPVILWIGIVGTLLAFEYHGPPLKLSYRGLGEIAVALCYGPLIALGTYAVQVRELSPPFALAAVPLGLLIAAFLWVNEFPDYDADKAGGKNTLVVRLGRDHAARWFIAIQALAFGLLAALPLFGITPGASMGLLALPLAIVAAVRLRRNFDKIPQLVLVQKLALIAFIVLAFTEGLGFLVETSAFK